MSPAAIEAMAILAAKYGPPVIDSIIALWKKSTISTVTVADVEAAFAPLKRYDEYGIPDVAPTKPAEPAVVAPV